jgi:hypothetical protein
LFQFAQEWGYALEVGWLTRDDLEQVIAIERKILEHFEKDHHELPPVNRSMP